MQRLGGRVTLITVLLGLSLSAQAAAFTLSELMGALANHAYGTAAFTETKYISILDLPVESSGELLFIPPSHLEKRTLKPKVETLVLDGEVLTVASQTQKHVLQIKDYPEVAGMIESIRATLAGDRQALERLYHLNLEGSPEGWALVLRPLDAAMGWMITRIRVEGTRDEVRTVEIQQADGDRSVMRVRQSASP
ncbi:LolA-related protein [uncultured Thiodictyon sp.]|uniref:LolA-related protein n=1 Tax=uncultured Thiodictyon sp. TaxID=1846217 RepID=UPI0025E7CAB8|nr:LolA-related protein [uncultured Thiodictyon sp.]